MTDQLPISFADGKDPEAFRTIGEVAQVLGVKQHVLRYWEEQFPMLKPLTRAGGRRYYRSTDVALIAEIDRLLHHEGFTIRGARQALGAKRVAVERPDVSAQIPELTDSATERGLRSKLTAMRNSLADALQQS